MSDWLSGKREEQLAMAEVWDGLLAPNHTKWGVPQDTCRAFAGAVSAATDALAEARNKSTCTPVVREHCNKMFKALAAAMRSIKNHYFFIPPLTEEDIIALGLRLHDVIKTQHGASEKRPLLDVIPKGRGEIWLIANNPDTDTHVKPDDGTVGVVYATRPRRADESAPDITELSTVFKRKTTFKLQLDQKYWGMTLDCACAYENAKGDMGPWSEMVSVVIG